MPYNEARRGQLPAAAKPSQTSDLLCAAADGKHSFIVPLFDAPLQAANFLLLCRTEDNGTGSLFRFLLGAAAGKPPLTVILFVSTREADLLDLAVITDGNADHGAVHGIADLVVLDVGNDVI